MLPLFLGTDSPLKVLHSVFVDAQGILTLPHLLDVLVGIPPTGILHTIGSDDEQRLLQPVLLTSVLIETIASPASFRCSPISELKPSMYQPPNHS